MTFNGSRGFGLSVTLVVTVLIALVFVLLSTDGGVADTTDIEGDWNITNRTVILENETVEVRGNVTVGEGGVLILENSTLYLNQSVVGTYMLVDRGGYLWSVDSRIRGSAYDSTFIIRNDTLLLRTNIVGFTNNRSEDAILVEDGMFEIRDSVVRVYGSKAMEVRTDLLVVNTWIDRTIDLLYNHPSIDRDISWEIRDSPREHKGNSINIEPSNGTVHITNALIDNMTISYRSCGLSVSLASGLNLTVTRCMFQRNEYAIKINEGLGGSVLIENNTIEGKGIDYYNVGIEHRVAKGSAVKIRYNLVERAYIAYNIYTYQGPRCTYVLSRALARDCRESVRATSLYDLTPPYFHIIIQNSSFLRMRYGFTVSHGACISIFDTEHQKGYGAVYEDGLFIRGYTPLDIGSVGWMNGGTIQSGTLDLRDDEGNISLSLEIERLEPIQIVGWQSMRFFYFIHEFLTPTVSRGGHVFMGDAFDIWDPMTISVLLVDDVSPDVQISYPAQEQYINEDNIVSKGTYVEFGSGLAGLSYILDGSDPVDLMDISSGKWTQPISELQDGLHTLIVIAVDLVGNQCTTGTVYYTIDTQLPIIEIDGIPPVVSIPTYNLTGRTEPFTSIMVSGKYHYVEHDGGFHIILDLREGPNDFLIWVTDKAGNINSTTVRVILDTTPPDLMVTSPWNGTWITERSVIVEGTTEKDAILKIDGETVSLSNGGYRHPVELTQGEVQLHIVVSDNANNSITRILVLSVDWTIPRILVESPEESPIFTSMKSMDVFGIVEDENLDTVTINGGDVSMLDGYFLMNRELVEGRNEIDIAATDMAGNIGTVTVVIFRDIELPGYSVELSLDGENLVKSGVTYHSPLSTLRLDMIASEPIVIELDGNKYGPDEEITIVLKLDEGRNDIAVSVRDRAGNLAQPYETVVVVDTVPPSLTGVRPLTGTKTKEDTITINGWTEPGVQLTINGIHYSISSDGSFVEELEIGMGVNEFAIIVTDLVGNSNSETIEVIGEEPDEVFRVSAVEYGLVLLLAAGAMLIVGVKVLRSKREKDVT